ncbi:MAG: LysR substrate-binding domain-containing protein [Rhodoblastus sp.]
MFSIDRARLPSTASLTAFEAAARLGSFTEAARELALTQGAISRQVKSLEEHLQVRLFERSAQRVALTETGRAVAIQVRSLLDQLQIALQEIAMGRPAPLVLGVLPTLATRWLIPKMPTFVAAHPNIAIELVTYRREFEPIPTNFDAVLTLGTQDSADIVSHKIGDEDFVAFATPHVIEQLGLKSAADLKDATLLLETTRPEIWKKWLYANGAEARAHTSIMRFNHFDMVISAARRHLGVGLAPRLLIEEAVQHGELRELDADPLAIGTAYFFSYPVQKATYPPLLIFRNWLLGVLEER